MFDNDVQPANALKQSKLVVLAFSTGTVGREEQLKKA